MVRKTVVSVVVVSILGGGAGGQERTLCCCGKVSVKTIFHMCDSTYQGQRIDRKVQRLKIFEYSIHLMYSFSGTDHMHFTETTTKSTFQICAPERNKAQGELQFGYSLTDLHTSFHISLHSQSHFFIYISSNINTKPNHFPSFCSSSSPNNFIYCIHINPVAGTPPPVPIHPPAPPPPDDAILINATVFITMDQVPFP